VMADEELIYRITRAVYGRLGSGVDERTVEQLVTDGYRAVEPVVAGNGSRAASAGSEVAAASESGSTSEREREARDEGSAQRLIISVFGVDHPGIVAGVSKV